MSYLYGALVLLVLYFLIKGAVAEGVKEALTDTMTSEDLAIFLAEAVSRGMEMHRQESEDPDID